MSVIKRRGQEGRNQSPSHPCLQSQLNERVSFKCSVKGWACSSQTCPQDETASPLVLYLERYGSSIYHTLSVFCLCFNLLNTTFFFLILILITMATGEASKQASGYSNILQQTLTTQMFFSLVSHGCRSLSRNVVFGQIWHVQSVFVCDWWSLFSCRAFKL